MMQDTPGPSNRRKARRMPSGAEMMADLRRRLDGFWNHPELSQYAARSTPSDLPTGLTPKEVAQAHLETVPTGLEGHPRSALRLVAKWTIRNGQMSDVQGQGNALPDDDHLVVLTVATTVTTVDSVVLDTHVALFERLG